MIDYIVENSRKIVFAVFFTTIIFVSIIFVKGIHYEFDEESFLPQNEIVRANEEVLQNYTNEYTAFILVKAKYGNILNKTALIEILQMEKRIYEATKAKQLSVADVISSAFLFFNLSVSYEEKIKEIEGKSDEDIKKLFHIPLISKRLSSFISLLLSKDFDSENVTAKACVVKISLDSMLIKDRDKALEEEKKIEEAIGEYDFIQPYLIGGRLIEEKIMNANRQSLLLLLPISFFLVVAVLLIIYRGIRDVLLSLLSIAIAIIWMYGFASLLNYSLNPFTTAVPVLLVGLGIDYSIHIRMRIGEEREKGRKEAIKISLRTVGVALILSALTTSIAFLSNISSFIPLLKQFGIISAFGIFSCLLITLFLAPFYSKTSHTLSNSFAHIAKIAHSKRIFILLLISFITILMSYFAFQIETEFDMMDFLPKELDLSKQIKYLLQEFEGAGGEEADILIEANVANPEVLKKIYETIENIKDDPYIVRSNKEAQIVSIFSVMKEYANETYGMKYNSTFSSLYYKIFDDELPKENATEEEIIELYDYLATIAPDDFKYVMRNDYSECVIRILTHTGKNEENISILYNELKKDLQVKNAVITGGIISSYVILKELRASQVKSLFFTVLISTFILGIVFIKRGGSLTLAFISMLPVVLSAIWIIGTMFLLHIPLNVTTITVASLAVGLGIDYSIHITHRFLEKENLVSTISSTGYALLGSALTTIAAFGLLSFSLLPPIRLFGIAISIAIIYSFILCTFFLPIILHMWKSFPSLK